MTAWGFAITGASLSTLRVTRTTSPCGTISSTEPTGMPWIVTSFWV